MKKGIRLTVSLQIEGEAEPAVNWVQLTIQAARDIIAAGQSAHPELAVTIRKVVEDTNYDDEDEEEDERLK